MKVTLDSAKFLQVSKSLAMFSMKRSGTIKRESNVLDQFLTLLVLKKKEYLLARHGDITIRKDVHDAIINCDERGYLSVPAEEFYNFIRSMPVKPTFELCYNPMIYFTNEKASMALPHPSDSLSCFNIGLPNYVRSYQTSITINKQHLLRCLTKLNPDRPTEYDKDREYLNYFYVHYFKNKLRFACHKGGCFVVYDFEGKQLCTKVEPKTKPISLLIPVAKIRSIIDIIRCSSGTNVTIAHPKKSHQIIIKSGDVEILYSSINPDLEYYNLDRWFDATFAYQITSKLDDWVFPTKGIRATNSLAYMQETPVHGVKIKANLVDGYFNLRPQACYGAEMLCDSNRHIPFIYNNYKVPRDATEKTFIFNSEYLSEIVKRGHKSEEVTLYLLDKDEQSPFRVSFTSQKRGTLTEQAHMLIPPLPADAIVGKSKVG